MSHQKSICVVGSLNYDLVTGVPTVPDGGQTVAATSFATYYGGKGANQAYALRRLTSKSDASVSIVGCVGQDTFGKELVAHLDASGVRTDRIKALTTQKTGTATILVEASGENRIMVYPGANGRVSIPAAREALEDLRPHYVVLQNEIPLNTTLAILEHVEELNTSVEGPFTHRRHRSSSSSTMKSGSALAHTRARSDASAVSITPGSPGSPNQAHKRILSVFNPSPLPELPMAEWPRVGLLCVNESEASALAGQKVDSRESAERALPVLLKGCDICVITLGGAGAVWQSQIALNSEEDLKPGFEKAHPVEKVVDTTGAGDTFLAALVSRMASAPTESLRSHIAFAQTAAALAVGKPGAASSIPTFEEVNSQHAK